jgi:hypothetical protein
MKYQSEQVRAPDVAFNRLFNYLAITNDCKKNKLS